MKWGLRGNAPKVLLPTKYYPLLLVIYIMSQLKAALFDLDGTLFDTEGQYSQIWEKLGLRYHPEIPDFAVRIKGNTLNRIMDNYFPDPSIRSQVIEELYAHEAQMTYRFFPGAVELLGNLRNNGIKVAVVTSSNRIKMAKVIRKMPDFESYFDHVFTAEDFAQSKPHPDCYLRAAAFFGAEPQECMVFEDALSGIRAGMAAGMYTIGITNTLPREAIEKECSLAVDSLEGMDAASLQDLLNQAR